MATMSTAPTPNPTIDPTTDHDTWNFSNGQEENLVSDKQSSLKNNNTTTATSKATNGASTNPYDFGFEPLPPARKKPSVENVPTALKGTKPWDRSNRSSDASAKPGMGDDTSSRRPFHGEKRAGPDNIVAEWDDESSKWIHRDKLAKIESRELQAAGFYMPRSRASSKARKARSQERPNGAKRTTSRTRDESEPPTSGTGHGKNESTADNDLSENQYPSWDLRLPEEIEAEADGYWMANDQNGGSKIPVAKVSPLPVPDTYIERPSPSSRSQSFDANDGDNPVYPKSRSRSGSVNALTAPAAAGINKTGTRSATDLSPKKNSAPRKTSAPTKTAPGGRPKTRNGSNKDTSGSNGTATRPTTRSGELSPQKAPEGDPPWMVGSYRPDPRLPPDQQLLPTVAKRLQQEKWEKEGKYGSIYDREFRPLTDDVLAEPPEAPQPEAESRAAQGDEEKRPDEWPLKPDPRSPTLKQGTSYSTIPKISDKPPASPVPGPRSPMVAPQQPAAQQKVTRVPDGGEAGDDAQKKKKGCCGCCIVM